MPHLDRSAVWKYVAAALGCVALGAIAYLGDRRVPLLGWVDLGFHELGHLLTYPLPPLITALMGSVTQVAVPLGLAFYFGLWTGDTAASGLCLAWAGTSARDVAVYVADAPFERLQLIGGDHDWAYILGPTQFHALPAAATISTWLRAAGLLLVAAGIVVAIWRLVPADPASSPPSRTARLRR